jgi:methionine-rich copper-binding protein CopC
MKGNMNGLGPIVFCLLIFAVQLAEGHAFPDRSEPAVGSQIASSPSVVKIWFTEKLEPALSKIQVFDQNKKEIDRRDVQAFEGNAAILIVSLPKLHSGRYNVVWRVVSVDTHVTTGSFSFEVTN